MKLRYKSLVARRARSAISDCLVINVVICVIRCMNEFVTKYVNIKRNKAIIIIIVIIFIQCNLIQGHSLIIIRFVDMPTDFPF